MANKIFCSYLKREEDALDRAPMPGELGQKIFENISKAAWQEWLAHQTMLINEKRLNPLDRETRRYLAEQTECFLFGDGAEMPEGYVPQDIEAKDK